MAGTWLGVRSGRFFFAQNFRILARKSVFCYRTPDFVNGPFVALGDSFDLAPSDPFLNFSFPSYGNFREGDPPTQQKVLPHLTVGALTDSNSPCALRFARGLDKINIIKMSQVSRFVFAIVKMAKFVKKNYKKLNKNSKLQKNCF